MKMERKESHNRMYTKTNRLSMDIWAPIPLPFEIGRQTHRNSMISNQIWTNEMQRGDALVYSDEIMHMGLVGGSTLDKRDPGMGRQ